MYLSLFDFTIVVIKKISITHPLNIDCRITNNPLCIVYEYLIWSPITGRFSKWGLLVFNKVNNNRALFGVSLPIKIYSTPRSGPGQSLTLTGYSIGLSYFTWIRWFKNVLIFIPPRSADPCFWSAVRCLLLRCTGNREFSKDDVDQNRKWNFM